MIKKERAWIEVNRENLKNNVNELKKCLREECEIMAVVKANSYGHGDILVSRELNRLGIYNFAVATLTEAIRLRQKKIEGNILVLGYTSPREAKEIYKYDIIQTIIDDKYAKELDESGYRVRAHVKIDTGMPVSYTHLRTVRQKEMHCMQNSTHGMAMTVPGLRRLSVLRILIWKIIFS